MTTVPDAAPDFAPIAAAIAAARGDAFRIERVRSVGGGSIHGAACLESGEQRYFVKFNAAAAQAMFDAEADGLRALADTRAVRVPQLIAAGCNGEVAFLVLEFFDLQALDRHAGSACGRALAELHRNTGDRFGWRRDNFIGATPQSNLPEDDHWPRFFAAHRLRPQLALAAGHGMAAKWLDWGEYVAEHLGGFFIDYRPPPSLLHGDLWSGNAGSLADGTPVIFDPAVYRGDREADLAMAELFGGFPEAFYAAYREAWPLDPGYETRKTLYNLYHVLNHFNLFGASYLGQAQRMIERLRAELKG
jgi:fructosamine-3-kinase